MKQKSIILLLIIAILSSVIIGCEKKAKFNTGDAELDSALEELWEEQNESERSKEVEETVEEAIGIKILESFVTTRQYTSSGKPYEEYCLVLKVDVSGLKDDTLYECTLIGENLGSSRELDKRNISKDETNIQLISKLDGNEKYIQFPIDWNGYSAYSLNLKQAKKEENLANYKISDFKKISYEDMIAKSYVNIFNSVNDETTININGIEISMLEASAKDGFLEAKVQFENKTNIPTDVGNIYWIKFITEDGKKTQENLVPIKIPEIMPNEKHENNFKYELESISTKVIMEMRVKIDDELHNIYLKK